MSPVICIYHVSAGRASAWYAGRHEFESHLRQGKEELSSGVVALHCLVSVTDFTCTCILIASCPSPSISDLPFLIQC